MPIDPGLAAVGAGIAAIGAGIGNFHNNNQKNNVLMGPLRFELRSEDPQSPRMARLPYGPALLL